MLSCPFIDKVLHTVSRAADKETVSVLNSLGLASYSIRLEWSWFGELLYPS